MPKIDPLRAQRQPVESIRLGRPAPSVCALFSIMLLGLKELFCFAAFGDIFTVAARCLRERRRITKTTPISCGRAPAAAAPKREVASRAERPPRCTKQSPANNSMLRKPAARLSVNTLVAVIQTAGVIARQVATHHPSRSVNWSRIIKNHAAIKSAPPRADTKCNESSGLAPKTFTPIQPRKMNNG